MLRQRMCIACRRLFNRDDLLCVRRTKDGNLVVAPDSKVMGRSAYICHQRQCIELVIKQRRLLRNLKIAVTLDELLHVHATIQQKLQEWEIQNG